MNRKMIRFVPAMVAFVFLGLLACRSSVKTADPLPPRTPADSGTTFSSWYRGSSADVAFKTDVPTAPLCQYAYAAVIDVPAISERLAKITSDWQVSFKSDYNSAVSAFTQEMGGVYGLTDYFTEELRQRGMILSADDIEKYIKYKQDPETWNYDSVKFDNEETCKDDMAAWTLGSAKSEDMVANQILRRKRFTDRWEREMSSVIEFTPILFLEKLVENCVDLKKSQVVLESKADGWMQKKYLEKRKALLDLPLCKNTLKAQTLAVEVTGREEVRFTEKELKEIVQPHLALFAASSDLTDVVNLESGVSDSISAFFTAQAARKHSCTALSDYQRDAIDDFYEQTQFEMKNSKAFIEKALSSFFSSYRRDAIVGNFNQAKAGVLAAIQTLIPDAGSAATVSVSMNATELVWPDIQNLKFKTVKRWNGNTITVLDEDAMDSDDTFWMVRDILGDSSLNAFYDPYTNPDKKHIYVMPATVWFAQYAQMALLAVLAHELGHDVYEQNKSLTHPAIDPIMQCMAAKESISLKKSQWSEAAADIVSEIATSKLISQLEPAADRKQAAVLMTLFFPYADVDSSYFQSKVDPHPNSVLRVSGIFSSAQGFRDNAGCGQEVSKFKVCL